MSQNAASLSAAPKPTIAFFGSTGGCCNAALALALKAGYQCTALARTPSKLTEMLSARKISTDTQTKYLRIIKGSVVDIETVKEVLTGTTSTATADIIISGIGMVFGKNPDSTICQKATRSILAAIDEIKPATKPFYITISSTGISKKARDVPYLMLPLYHVLLSIPHKDKRVMDELVVEAAEKDVISGYTLVRPTLLSSGAARGMDMIRAGTAEKPAVGYYISREDVGLWMYEELVAAGVGGEWRNGEPSLTY